MGTTDELKELRDTPELQAALDESHRRPVLLFKHSLSCEISQSGRLQLEAYMKNPPADVAVYLVIVQNSRTVSDELARRLGVEHQTPQAILVCDGKPVWHASHFDVTRSALEGAVASGQGSVER
ncbi:MAG: bacillithiol system redox-active protein YtxJ [Acidobacteriota bacterium]